MIAFSKTRIGRWFATLGRARAALKDKTGNATIEFALVIPLFAVIVVGSADIGMLIFSRFKLEGAVSASVSYAVAHVDQVDSANGGALAKNLVSIVANNSSDAVDVLVDINNGPQAVNEGAKVTLDGQPARAEACYCPKGTPSSLEWGAQYSCNAACPNGGRAGKYVAIIVKRDYAPFSSMLGALNGSTIAASAMVQAQ